MDRILTIKHDDQEIRVNWPMDVTGIDIEYCNAIISAVATSRQIKKNVNEAIYIDTSVDSVDSSVGKILAIGYNDQEIKVNWPANITDIDIGYCSAIALSTAISRHIKGEKTKDFGFIIYGNSYILDYLPGEALNFIIDWGDGTENIVDSTVISQRSHTYTSNREWGITIKKYASGWITFASSSSNRSKLIRITTPFPPSLTRKSFENVFYYCINLVSVCNGLFDKNVNANNFISSFYGCSSLALIPIGIFDKFPTVTSFYATFYNCAFTTIPNGIFDKNVNLEDLRECFYNCVNLNSIPNDIFHNNLKITTVDSCFSNTAIKMIPNDIFDNNLDIRVFRQCFMNCTLVTGYAPQLWLRTISELDGYRCFFGCIGLTNYNDIPSDWK